MWMQILEGVGGPPFNLPQQVTIFRYAMKCLDKKRIKMKQGETLALNERIMLSLVSTGVSILWPPGAVRQKLQTR